MKKLYKLFFLVIIINSCNTVNYKRFTYYKQVPKIQSSFRINGVYYRFKEFHGGNGDDRYWAGLFFFYTDGTVIAGALTMENSSDKDVASKLSSDFYKTIENAHTSGGAYLINGDSLKTQMFASTQHQSLFNMDILENCFLINRGTNTLTYISSFCNWCPKNEKKDSSVLIPNPEYNFLPLKNKPDSSKLWYKKTKWYKEGLGIRGSN